MKINDVILYAWRFIGKPYIYGANGPDAYDCSGLVCEILKAFGVIHYSEDLTAQDLYHAMGRKYSHLPPTAGAILFFGKTNETVFHTGLAISPSLMIEAGGGDSATTTREVARAKCAFVRIRPISMRKDFLCAYMPAYKDVEF